MASSAVSLGNLLLARKAFEQALRRNEGYWPAIEGLSGVLFALDDYRGMQRVCVMCVCSLCVDNLRYIYVYFVCICVSC